MSNMHLNASFSNQKFSGETTVPLGMGTSLQFYHPTPWRMAHQLRCNWLCLATLCGQTTEQCLLLYG